MKVTKKKVDKNEVEEEVVEVPIPSRDRVAEAIALLEKATNPNRAQDQRWPFVLKALRKLKGE